MRTTTFNINTHKISSLNDFLCALVKDNTILEYKTTYGSDVYLFASCNGHLEIMKYLEKEHNWNIHVKTIYGNDVYLLASRNGHLEIMKYLENVHNWDVNIKSKYGFDAYLVACANDQLEIMIYLEKEHDWDVFVKTEAGDNAYSLSSTERIKDHLEKNHSWYVGAKLDHERLSRECKEIAEREENKLSDKAHVEEQTIQEEAQHDVSINDLVTIIKNKLSEKDEKIKTLENELKTLRENLLTLAL
jgi:ankyrin repeat protein